MKRYALIIGIDDYPDAPLSYCCRDAKALKAVLDKDFDEIILLKNQNATSSNIIAAWNKMRRNMNPGDLFLFYFSGHGEQRNDVDGFWCIDGFCKIKDIERLTNKIYINRLFIFDCCRTSLYTEGKTEYFWLEPMVSSEFPAVIAPVILSACCSGRTAVESDHLSHSIFTDNILRALKNRNLICLKDFLDKLSKANLNPAPQFTVSPNNYLPILKRWQDKDNTRKLQPDDYPEDEEIYERLLSNSNDDDAFEALWDAANKGQNAYAQFCLAKYYKDADDDVKAFTYFKHGAEQDNPDSMIELAKCYYYGDGTAKNQQQAMKILQDDLLEDNSKAQELLNEWLDDCNIRIDIHNVQEPSDSQLRDPYCNIHTDIRNLQVEVNRGKTEAEYKLGELYLHGIGVEENWQKAYELSARAALKGHLAAQFNTAYCLYEGCGVKRNTCKAEAAFKQIKSPLHREAAKGNPVCQYALSYMYYKGLGVEKNDRLAFKCIQAAAKQGLPQALYDCALHYNDGIGVQTDFSQAFKFWQDAADARVYSAYIDLANCYADGKGIKKDLYEADRYYHLAAEKGHLGKLNLAWWLSGNDAKKANELIQSSMKYLKFDADNNNLERMFYYALYLKAENTVKAFKYFKCGAEQEDHYSMIELAKCYYDGVGTAKDQQKAIKILQDKLLKDNSEAQDLLSEWDSEPEITPSQSQDDKHRNEVKNIIAEYKKKIPNLFDNSHIPSACEKFIEANANRSLLFARSLLLGGYCRKIKQNTLNKKYEFFVVYTHGLMFFKNGFGDQTQREYIPWSDMESINAANDGIMIDGHKLTLSERIGTIANLIRDLRDLFVEYVEY